jgi:hypothetical protein
MAIRYQANQPYVAAESIDGEAVIVQLNTGDYFSAPGTGCLIWEWICQGASPEEVVGALQKRYVVDTATAATVVDRFVADLVAHQLLRVWADAPDRVVLAAPDPGQDRAEWVTPRLEVYSDMKDLLVLDPIHEVEDTGWPIPKPRTAGE